MKVRSKREKTSPPPEIERKGDRNESVTVLRACEVLKAFRTMGAELLLADVVERTGLPKTTSFRLLRTLVHGGLIERVGSGVYRNRFSPVARSSRREPAIGSSSSTIWSTLPCQLSRAQRPSALPPINPAL